MFKVNNKLSLLVLFLVVWNKDCVADVSCNSMDVCDIMANDGQLLCKALNSLCIPMDYKPCIEKDKHYSNTEEYKKYDKDCTDARSVFCVDNGDHNDFEPSKFGNAAQKASEINSAVQSLRGLLKDFCEKTSEEKTAACTLQKAERATILEYLESAGKWLVEANNLVHSQLDEKYKRNEEEYIRYVEESPLD